MTRAERLAAIVEWDRSRRAEGWEGDTRTGFPASTYRFLLDLLREARAALVGWEGSPWESHLYPLAERTNALLADLAPLEERPDHGEYCDAEYRRDGCVCEGRET